jgi:uncharacterized protein YndB with AHSA1/START domain
MAPISVTVDVDRPADEVFAYATDPARFHEWQQGVVDGHLEQAGAPAVGTRCVTTRRIGGANRQSVSEISHISPPETWGVRGVDGPIRSIVDVTVDRLAAHRSRLTVTVDFTGHGIGRVLVPLMVRPEARKEMPANVAKLKRRLEGR